MRRPSTIVVGAGPAGMGLLVCAAQRGRLEPLLDGGLTVVERGTAAGSGNLGQYALNSDSLATSFVECLEHPQAGVLFRDVARTALAQDLVRRRERHVPLAEVAAFLGLLGEALRHEIERHPRGLWLSRTEARSLALGRDGELVVELRTAGPGAVTERLSAENVVLALGAMQDRGHVLDQSVAGCALRSFAARIRLTDELVTRGSSDGVPITGQGDRCRIVIVGGSHSAFSSAWALTEKTADPIDIVILHRDRLRVFYPSPAAALADHYDDFTADDVCPRTGRLHRLGGLRGDGRELWRRVTGRVLPAEHRVRIERIAPGNGGTRRVHELIDRADLVVPAFGYRPRMVPLSDASGGAIPLGAADHGDLVGSDGRIVLANGGVVPGLFGMGMASGFRPPGEASFRGQTNGVWLYHNVAGEVVLDGLTRASAPRA